MASNVKKGIASLVEQGVKPMCQAVMSRAFLLRKATILVLSAFSFAFWTLMLVTMIHSMIVYPKCYTDVPIYKVLLLT